MQVFSSKIKFTGIWVLPILVLIMALLVPQIHWSLAILISLIFLLFKMWNLRKLTVNEKEIAVKYPFRVVKKEGYNTGLERVRKIIYVDRKDAVRGTYPHSHINIHFKESKKFQQVKVILDKEERKGLNGVLKDYGIDFSSTTELEVNEI